MGASHGFVPVNTHSTPVPSTEGRLWVARYSNTAPHKMSPNSDKFGPEEYVKLEEVEFIKCFDDITGKELPWQAAKQAREKN